MLSIEQHFKILIKKGTDRFSTKNKEYNEEYSHFLSQHSCNFVFNSTVTFTLNWIGGGTREGEQNTNTEQPCAAAIDCD